MADPTFDRPTLDRRALLKLAAATAAVSWGGRLQAQLRWADNPFTLGVASGSPLADGVVLWTRLVNLPAGTAAVPVRWEIAHDEGFARVVRSGEASALPQLAHSVHVEAGGLAPDRGYFYRFTAGGWASPVGRTRTLPAADAQVQRLRIAYASCQRWEHGYFGAWRAMREDVPDFVLFLGDYIYEYPGAANAVRANDGVWATTLDDYRRRYALYRTDADLQAMHRAAPWITTWDDHEVQNDYAGEFPGNAGPEVADFAARRAAAYQAYYEHMPVRASAWQRAVGQGELRIYTQQRFGTLADLCVLDTRQYRGRQVCNKDGKFGSSTADRAGCAEWNDPARTLLGAAQEQWLDAQLARRGATWTVLGQSTLFGARDMKPGPGQSFWNDGWDGYAAARSRLVASLQKNAAPNPVLLGGDVHENWVGHVKADYARPDSANVGVEFCGTSITSRTGGADKAAERFAENPHFVFADGYKRGYGIADFTPRRLEVTLRAMDDVTRRDMQASVLARFAVEAGRPVVERA